MLRLPVSGTAKVMYARLLAAVPASGMEDTGLLLRVRQRIGEPNRIYVLVPRKQD